MDKSLVSSIGADWLDRSLALAEAKVIRLAERVGGAHLHAGRPHHYPLDIPEWWTSGFWPGMLWLAYQGTRDKRLASFAKQSEDGIWATIHDDRLFELHHDVGFQFLPTSVIRYRLTGDQEARRRGILAAMILASRYNPKSGVIEAWNGERRDHSIIDTLINLPLLFWATEETGERRYYNIALAHLDKALDHWVRSDGTTHHVLRFDAARGGLIETLGGQGFAPGSVWTRGHSWAALGLSLAYRHTGEARFLHAAGLVVDAFLDRLPAHGVPPWDFLAPNVETAPRDSSAGAIVACALLELASHLDEAEGLRRRHQAAELLKKLSDEVGLLDDSESDALLAKATGKKPKEENVEVAIIYGDYYFLEALYRLKGGVHTVW
jgi:unsaturated chondroitin disaccharide hydrolase